MTSWRVVSIHHVAVARGEDAIGEALFEQLLGSVVHEEPGVGFVERMYPAGDAFVQVLEAQGPGVVQRSLDRRGPGLHHVAFGVEGLDAALDELDARGVALIDRHARPGGMGTRIAFLHPSAAGGVLVELVETAAGGADDG